MGHRVESLGKVKVDDVCLGLIVEVSGPIVQAFEELSCAGTLFLEPMLVAWNGAISLGQVQDLVVKKPLHNFDNLAGEGHRSVVIWWGTISLLEKWGDVRVLPFLWDLTCLQGLIEDYFQWFVEAEALFHYVNADVVWSWCLVGF